MSLFSFWDTRNCDVVVERGRRGDYEPSNLPVEQDVKSLQGHSCGAYNCSQCVCVCVTSENSKFLPSLL